MFIEEYFRQKCTEINIMSNLHNIGFKNKIVVANPSGDGEGKEYMPRNRDFQSLI